VICDVRLSMNKFTSPEYYESMRADAKDKLKGNELASTLDTIDKLEEANSSLLEHSTNIKSTYHLGKTESLNITNLKKEVKLINDVKEKLKKPVYKNKVKNDFKKKLYLFRLSVSLLIIAAVITITIFNMLNIHNQAYILTFVISFFCAYFYLGAKFWKCPACGYKLNFLSKFKGTVLISM
jgi:hypothetical protein